MRALVYATIALVTLTSIAGAAPLSQAELKNLLAAIRQNRSTQADFHEERVIRLMKKPVVSSGTVWFQTPNKFRRVINVLAVAVSEARRRASVTSKVTTV
jgi:outer membrane lipoprotein-sorting protein